MDNGVDIDGLHQGFARLAQKSRGHFAAEQQQADSEAELTAPARGLFKHLTSATGT